MRIGTIIIEEGLSDLIYKKKRETVRAIIKQNDQILMIYSHLFNDYTFPGGGIKAQEIPEKALQRELYEELGAVKIEVISYLGHTEEVRYGINQTSDIYQQISYYYEVKIIENGEQHLIELEVLHGLEPRWIKIDDAIQHNLNVIRDEKHTQRGFKTVLIRENEVLNTLKEK